MQAIIEKRDGRSGWSDRLAAYRKLMPLVWGQLLQQAKHFAIFVDVMSEVMGGFGANSLRAEEDLNGSLQLRLGESESDAKKEPDSLFRQCFCALSKNLFLVYSDDRSMMPLEIICLQYATVTANRDWSHAFNIDTPIVKITIRAPDDFTLERWTNAIFALQCSDGFEKLVPQGMRQQHLFARLTGGKGGNIAMRLLRRIGARNVGDVEYTKALLAPHYEDVSSAGTAHELDGIGFELSSMIKDQKLGGLLKSYAAEIGQEADLELYTSINEAVKSDGESLDVNQVETLSLQQKRQLLRLSSTYLKMPSDAGDEPERMQEAYDRASARLIGELLPRFCETEAFKSWLTQQQEDERLELQFLAVVQSPVGYNALLELVRGKTEEHALSATVKIEELLATSSFEKPAIDLAEDIIHSFFSPAATTPVLLSESDAKDRLLAAVRSWTSRPEDNTSQQDALSAFRTVLLVDLRPMLMPSLLDLKTSPSFLRVLADMQIHEEQKSGLLHVLHTQKNFDMLREWMAERRASESLDFIADVIKFKAIEDISMTKENALRIHSKYIAEGALAQVCLPAPLINCVEDGLQPRFPSDMLFDDAVEHITQFVSQDLWEEYKSESTFREFSAHLSSALSLGKTPSLLISIRWLGCTMRHVIPLSKRVVTIGSGNACDIAVIEAGSVNTMVINIELQPAGGGALVSMLWNASPQRARESRSSALSTAASMSERSRPNVIARYKPKSIKFGDYFIVGDYEAMIIPFDRT